MSVVQATRSLWLFRPFSTEATSLITRTLLKLPPRRNRIILDLPDDVVVGVLQLKEWFEWDDESVPLQAGTSLIFRVQSQVTFKNNTSYRDLSTSGEIFVHRQFVKVGSVDFQQDDYQGNSLLPLRPITILAAFRLLSRALRARVMSLTMPGLTSDTNPPKLGGYRFYEEVLGSPKHVVALMVDQSELVSKTTFRLFYSGLLYQMGLEDSVSSIWSTGE
jgi:hypothetical protein